MSASKINEIFCAQQTQAQLKKLYEQQQQQPPKPKPIDENRLLLSKVQKWDSATTLKFLKIYHKYPCLWDMTHKHYKDRYVRQLALEKMAEYMNLQNFDYRYVALKIRVLRTTYMEERRKIQRRSAETGYLTTQLDWFKFADSFLRNNIVRVRKYDFRKSKHDVSLATTASAPKDNIIDENINNNVNDKNVPNNANDFGQITVKTEFCENTETNNLNDNQTSPNLFFNTNNEPQQQNDLNSSNRNDLPELNYLNHNNHNDDDYDDGNSVEKRRLSFNGIYNNGTSSTTVQPKKFKLDDCNKDDEFDCFGKSVAAQLKSLPLDRAYELELKIQYLLTSAKLEAFGKTASNVLNMNFL